MNRLDFAWDINGDGGVTSRDVLSWVGWVATLPGDLARDAVVRSFPRWAEFWHMGPHDWMGWHGFFWSLPFWFAAWALWGVLFAPAAPPDTPQ